VEIYDHFRIAKDNCTHVSMTGSDFSQKHRMTRLSTSWTCILSS